MHEGGKGWINDRTLFKDRIQERVRPYFIGSHPPTQLRKYKDCEMATSTTPRRRTMSSDEMDGLVMREEIFDVFSTDLVGGYIRFLRTVLDFFWCAQNF